MNVFATIGEEKSKIDVRISYRIIQLFSEGLYKSPNKAIEELVSNAFDAGATKTQVILSPDLGSSDAIIAVIDNGQGMDEEGLEKHWLIGVSEKRSSDYKSPLGRKQIGKFGIGKLATYVLSNEFTHITKYKNKYFAATMDYKSIPEGEKGGIYTEEKVRIPLRELTEEETKEALEPVLKFADPNFKEIVLFGNKSETSWTIAIMSNLKDMAREIKQGGRLKWVLETAMPLRDDFQLYLNSTRILPSKIKLPEIKKWVLGKDLKELPRCDDLTISIDSSKERISPEYFGLIHPKLGRITGYAELYSELLTQGKSSEIARSNGFFVYARGRLINIDDAYFGLDSNQLRHGTFSRLRAVLYIDRLDDELRSTREDVRQGALFEETRNLLQGIFSVASAKLAEIERDQNIETRVINRIVNTPRSLSQTPLVCLIEKCLDGNYSSFYTDCPMTLSKKQKASFISRFKERASSDTGVITSVEQVETLSQSQAIALFDPASGTLKINLLHPFITQFFNEYNGKARDIALELFVTSEVLLEAHMLGEGIAPSMVKDILSQRDELFRTLSSTIGKRNMLTLSQDLKDAATNKDKLEDELVAVFNGLGFEASKISGKDNPDGLATASLSVSDNGQSGTYKITLEAKSKEAPNKKVSAKTVGVSTLARHRRKYNADYSVVVGPDFPTGRETSALAKEIKEDRNHHPGKGITLIRIEDMSRLVRLVPLKRIGLDRLRNLFEACSIPEEAKAWIENIAKENLTNHIYRQLLDVIAEEQRQMPTEHVEYANVVTGLRHHYGLKIEKQEVKESCKALSRMAPGFVYATTHTVEITQKPDRILDMISATINDYPADEKRDLRIT